MKLELTACMLATVLSLVNGKHRGEIRGDTEFEILE